MPYVICKVEHFVHRKMEAVEKVVHMADLIHEELDTMAWENLTKVEGVKTCLFKLLKCVVKIGSFNFYQVNHV